MTGLVRLLYVGWHAPRHSVQSDHPPNWHGCGQSMWQDWSLDTLARCRHLLSSTGVRTPFRSAVQDAFRVT